MTWRPQRVGHYYPKHGHERSGVTSSIDGWTSAMRLAGQEVVILADAGAVDGGNPGQIRPVRHWGDSRATFVPRGLRAQLHDLDLLYLHEGWTLSNLAAARACRAEGLPYVVMPHGVYEPGITSTLKPPLGPRTRAERWVLEHALAVHVFFASEGPLVTDVAPRAVVVVSPTGVSSAPGGWSGQGDYIAWFGRYEPHHKGLDLLLEGLAKVPSSRRPRLEMRGYDYQGGRDRLRAIVDRLGLAEHVRVGEEVRGEDVVTFLRSASAYVHPSRWESHSVALTEVLALGVPTWVSSSIHIAEPLAHDEATVLGGDTSDSWAAALDDGRAFDNADLGERGRSFVERRLSWPRVLECLWAQLPTPPSRRPT